MISLKVLSTAAALALVLPIAMPYRQFRRPAAGPYIALARAPPAASIRVAIFTPAAIFIPVAMVIPAAIHNSAAVTTIATAATSVPA